MRYILAFDEGTTSARAIVIDAEGRVKAIAQKEFAQHFPQSGWVEHDAEEIWAVAGRRGVRGAEPGERGRQADLAAVRHRQPAGNHRRLGPGDRACPIGPAIVWQDRRTAGGVRPPPRRRPREGLIRARTGLLIDAYFSGTKVAWLLDHVPGARAQGGGGGTRLRHRR